MMKFALTAGAVLFATSAFASASLPTAVPEIDAAAGAAALAVVAGAVALIRERSKR